MYYHYLKRINSEKNKFSYLNDRQDMWLLLYEAPFWSKIPGNYPGCIQGSTLDFWPTTLDASRVLWTYEQLPWIHPGQYLGCIQGNWSKIHLGCIQGNTLDFCTFTPDQNILPWMIIITDRHNNSLVSPEDHVIIPILNFARNFRILTLGRTN